MGGRGRRAGACRRYMRDCFALPREGGTRNEATGRSRAHLVLAIAAEVSLAFARDIPTPAHPHTPKDRPQALPSRDTD